MPAVRGWLVLGLAAALAACATPATRPGAQNPATVTRSLNLSGYPPEFRRGFTDGCTAARNAPTASRPTGDAQYVMGWSDGLDYCKPKAAK
jgi:hypothetical protein